MKIIETPKFRKIATLLDEPQTTQTKSPTMSRAEFIGRFGEQSGKSAGDLIAALGPPNETRPVGDQTEINYYHLTVDPLNGKTDFAVAVRCDPKTEKIIKVIFVP